MHPIGARFEAHRESAAVGHRAQRVVAEIPEDLLQRVTIGSSFSASSHKIALDLIRSARAGVMLEKHERVLDQGCNVHVGERVSLLPRVIQEIGNDLVEALGLAADDLDEFFVVVLERRQAGQFLQRSGHRRERLANFVSDRSREPPEYGHAFLGENFLLEAF